MVDPNHKLKGWPRGSEPYLLAITLASSSAWSSSRRTGTKKIRVLEVNTEPATAFEVSDDLPDEARAALIDIDMTSNSIRGHRLRWDGKQWQPVSDPES